ncbi:MAG: isoprenylcysteine carboxylmethyltransferase family protein [Caldilineaceae bacterium]|nr:isoprenylcysteine carboxylmethyltransferase family protein [Caldilineaceae bacterium]
MKLISTFALPVVMLAALYLLISGSLFSINLLLVVQGLAIALMVWARRSFQPNQFSIHAQPTEGHMFSSGPYRAIRHPMYAGALAIIWSGILGHISLLNLAIGAAVTIVISIRIMVEEQYLLERFPDYREYSRKTRRLIPFVTGLLKQP